MSLGRLLAFIAMLAAASAAAVADTVVLRNGMKIRGRVLSESDSAIVVKVRHGVVRLDADEVLSVDRSAESANLLDDALELARAGHSREGLQHTHAAEEAGASPEDVRRVRIEVLQTSAAKFEGRLRLAEAHTALLEAKSLAPHDDRIALSLARVTRRLAELRDLVESARSAAQRDDLASAFDLYERSMLAAPEMRQLIAREFADVCEGLGDEALGESGRHAAHWYDRALSLEPGRATSLRQRYIHAKLLPVLDLLQKDRVDAALQSISALVDFAPSDSQVRYVYGRILESCGEVDEARRQYIAAAPPSTAQAPSARADASLEVCRSRAEAHLRAIQEEADTRRLEREQRSFVEPGPARRMEGEYFVVHHRNSLVARQVLEKADGQVRRILAARGGDARIRWPELCSIYLLPSADSFLDATGQPPWSGGLSHTESVNGRLARQYLTVYQTSSKLVESTVPHEVAHLVFSAMTDYAAGVPLAIHEGFAVSQESEKRDEGERGLLVWRRLSGGLIPVSDLLSATEVGDDPALFYTQSESLVAFLLSRPGGLPVFVEFARSVARHGMNAALRRHYGLADVGELESTWLSSLDE